MKNEAVTEVHVDEIMKEIRRKIQMESAQKPIPSFEDIPLAVGEDDLLGSLEHLDLYSSLGSPSIKTFIKRIIRRLILPFLLPIANNQNLLNESFLRCLSRMQALEETCQALEKRCRELENINQKLDGRVKSLEELQLQAVRTQD